MTQAPVVLFVSFSSLPDQEGALVHRLLSLAQESLKESKCNFYTVHRDLDEIGRVWLYEYWDNQAVLDAHNQTGHVKTFVTDLPSLAKLPFEVWRTAPESHS